MRACCFTGHRNIPKYHEEILRSRVRFCIENYIKDGGKYFACGGAMGFDLLAAEEVLKMKMLYPQIQMILLLPYVNFTSRWPESEKQRLHKILSQSIYRYCSPCYQNRVYLYRDDILVQGSDTCICYLTRERSGTGYTVRQAVEQSLWICNIADENLWTQNPFKTAEPWYI